MPSELHPVDLEQFESLDDALLKIERHRPFDGLVGAVLRDYSDADGAWTFLMAFFGSAAARGRGLHEAIVREIRAGNPHAVFPLLRQFAETVALVFYVADQPDYVHALIDRQRGEVPKSRRRVSTQKLITNLDRKHSKQFGAVYAELSEVTHFGTVAMWMPHTIVDEGKLATRWNSAPQWRREKDALIACAWLLELSGAMDAGLVMLGKTLLAHATDEPVGTVTQQGGFEP